MYTFEIDVFEMSFSCWIFLFEAGWRNWGIDGDLVVVVLVVVVEIVIVKVLTTTSATNRAEADLRVVLDLVLCLCIVGDGKSQPLLFVRQLHSSDDQDCVHLCENPSLHPPEALQHCDCTISKSVCLSVSRMHICLIHTYDLWLCPFVCKSIYSHSWSITTLWLYY